MRIRLIFWLLLLPYLMVIFGAGCNLAAITANHGLMPFVPHTDWTILPGQVPDPHHIAWDSHVRLGFLCDWIQWFDGNVWSIGDIFLETGDWLRWPTFVLSLGLLWDSSQRGQECA